MARPKKTAGEKRRNLTVRFSDVERAQLEIEAQAQGTVLGDHIRQLCDKGRRHVVRQQPLPQSLKPAAFAAVHRFGSLLNTITKTANQNGHISPDLPGFCDRARFFLHLTIPANPGELDRAAVDQLRRIGVNLIQLRNVATFAGQPVPPTLDRLHQQVERLLMEAIAA